MDIEILNACEPLIKSIANKFYGIDKEDLIQAGKVGLINAYNHYDKNSNAKFSTFAYSYIFGEMYNLSLGKNMIKSNRDTLKLIKLIDKTKIYLTQTLGKEPSLNEISSYLEIDEEIIKNAITSTESTLSLDKDSDSDESLYNLFRYEEDNDTRLDVMDGIHNLTDEEKNIILCRYFNDLTQSETAKKLKMSQVKVSRYEQKSLKKLKNIMTHE